MGALRRALVPLLRDPGDTAISPSILLYANSLEPLEQPSSPQLWSRNNAQLHLNLQPVSSESAWSLTLASFQSSGADSSPQLLLSGQTIKQGQQQLNLTLDPKYQTEGS